MLKRFAVYISIMILLTGCFNSSIMLRTKKDYQYTVPPTVQAPEYKISANDIVEIRIFTNDGFKLVDLTSLSEDNSGIDRTQFSQQYLVEFDGMMKLPILGRVSLKGMTVREAELFLEEKYSGFYIKPFLLLNVSNRRVIVFPGAPGDAKVVPLLNNNTTLIEALALAGGISQNGKAKKIKLIRGNLSNPEIYLIDLSTIEGMKQANLVLQANDIIYIEPRLNIAKGVISEITPIVSIFTTAIVLFTFFLQVSK